MGDRRRSGGLRSSDGAGGGAKRTRDKRTPKRRARDSVDGVLGLTPRIPKGRNLQVTKSAEAAAAATAKLDRLEVAERSARLRRKSNRYHATAH